MKKAMNQSLFPLLGKPCWLYLYFSTLDDFTTLPFSHGIGTLCKASIGSSDFAMMTTMNGSFLKKDESGDGAVPFIKDQCVIHWDSHLAYPPWLNTKTNAHNHK